MADKFLPDGRGGRRSKGSVLQAPWIRRDNLHVNTAKDRKDKHCRSDFDADMQ